MWPATRTRAVSTATAKLAPPRGFLTALSIASDNQGSQQAGAIVENPCQSVMNPVNGTHQAGQSGGPIRQVQTARLRNNHIPIATVSDCSKEIHATVIGYGAK